jgi:protein TonB
MDSTSLLHDEWPTGGRESSPEAAIAPAPMFAARVGASPRAGGWAWPVTVSLHALGAAAIVVLPLLGSEILPVAGESVTRAFFVAPSFVAPPPPPPPPAPARPSVAPRVAPKDQTAAFTAPIDVPQEIPDEGSLDLGIEGGVPGGVEGGVPGGVVGGVVGGLEDAPPPPPAQVVRVGGVIREPKKVKDVAPVYPSIAKTAKIQGVVILECQLNPQGRVESVKVLRSVPTLDGPAVEAVRQWVYTPTLVNGVPVSVVMTVTVNFVLRDPGMH